MLLMHFDASYCNSANVLHSSTALQCDAFSDWATGIFFFLYLLFS